MLVKIQRHKQSFLRNVGGQGHSCSSDSLRCERALSSPRGPLCVLCSAHGSLNSMGSCWAQTGSGVYAFLYYSPVLQGWCGHGTCHSLVFLTCSEALSTLANSYLISSVFCCCCLRFCFVVVLFFTLYLFLQAWLSLPNRSQHSRLMVAVTCIRASFLCVTNYDPIVCLIFNAEKHPCGVWTPKNHIPDCPRGQSDARRIWVLHILQDSVPFIWSLLCRLG